jgi:NADH:ubiquinone oxidoreductase subunit H
MELNVLNNLIFLALGIFFFDSILMLILEIILSYLALILPLLLAVAYFTLYERHILAALQRRQGPNVVGYYGLFQPLTDGLKLFVKESIFPKSANTFIFLVSPIFTFGLARTG